VKRIFLSLFLILGACAALAQEAPAKETVSDLSLIVGQTITTHPAGMFPSSYTVVEGGDCVRISQAGIIYTFTGLKVGDATVKLTYAEGYPMTLRIHVRQHSFAEGPDVIIDPPAPEEPGGTAAKPKWTGHCVFWVPANWYCIQYRQFGADGKDTGTETFALIDNMLVRNTLYIESPEKGFYCSMVCERFDYSTKLGYYGGMAMDDKRARLWYGDGNEIASENEEDGHSWFKTFAPKKTSDALLYLSGPLTDFGRDNEHYDEDELQPGAVLQRFRQYRRDEAYLGQFYRGEEEICGVKCWVFDFRHLKDYGIADGCWWVDPTNCLTLQFIGLDGSGFSVIRYDLDYTRWDLTTRPEFGNDQEWIEIGPPAE
jgi:hypothetical protein